MAEKFRYEHIVNHEHHISKKHPQATMHDRAAQFAPFAAITGYSDMLIEAARVTEAFVELDDGTKEELNKRLQMIADFIRDEPEITFTHFVPDKKKDGGAYVSTTGIVKRIDEYERQVLLVDGTKIPIEYIFGIEGDLFLHLEADN